MEAQSNEKKKSTFPDRVNLTYGQSKRLEIWVQQIKEVTQGALRISKSDLVNFVLEEMNKDLSEEQMIRLEIKFYNETRWLAWAMGQIKKAEKEERKLQLEDLMKAKNQRWNKSKTLSANIDGLVSKKLRKSKASSNMLIDTTEPSTKFESAENHEGKA